MQRRAGHALDCETPITPNSATLTLTDLLRLLCCALYELRASPWRRQKGSTKKRSAPSQTALAEWARSSRVGTHWPRQRSSRHGYATHAARQPQCTPGLVVSVGNSYPAASRDVGLGQHRVTVYERSRPSVLWMSLSCCVCVLLCRCVVRPLSTSTPHGCVLLFVLFTGALRASYAAADNHVPHLASAGDCVGVGQQQSHISRVAFAGPQHKPAD
jgi:hypothetical protein